MLLLMLFRHSRMEFLKRQELPHGTVKMIWLPITGWLFERLKEASLALEDDRHGGVGQRELSEIGEDPRGVFDAQQLAASEDLPHGLVGGVLSRDYQRTCLRGVEGQQRPSRRALQEAREDGLEERRGAKGGVGENLVERQVVGRGGARLGQRRSRGQNPAEQLAEQTQVSVGSAQRGPRVQ